MTCHRCASARTGTPAATDTSAGRRTARRSMRRHCTILQHGSYGDEVRQAGAVGGARIHRRRFHRVWRRLGAATRRTAGRQRGHRQASPTVDCESKDCWRVRGPGRLLRGGFDARPRRGHRSGHLSWGDHLRSARIRGCLVCHAIGTCSCFPSVTVYSLTSTGAPSCGQRSTRREDGKRQIEAKKAACGVPAAASMK
jgi:hypothetical protein